MHSVYICSAYLTNVLENSSLFDTGNVNLRGCALCGAELFAQMFQKAEKTQGRHGPADLIVHEFLF